MPVKVIERASGAEVEVSAAELQDDIVSGRGAYMLPSGELTVSDGREIGVVDAADLMKVIGGGYEVVDDDYVRDFDMRTEAQSLTNQALGTLEAIAAGASLGGSTWWESEVLGYDTEEMRYRREGLGAFGDVAEFAGAIVPAVASGGLGAAGGAARASAAGARVGSVAKAATYTPAGLASYGAGRLGLAAGEAVGQGVGRTVVQTGTRGVVEGFFYGAGSEFDDQVLNNDLNAEDILASGGMGALIGGPTEVGGGLLLHGASRAAARWGRRDPIRALDDVVAADAGATKLDADGNVVVDPSATRGIGSTIARADGLAGFTESALRNPTFRKYLAKTSFQDPDELGKHLDFTLDDPQRAVLLNENAERATAEMVNEVLPMASGFNAARRKMVSQLKAPAYFDDIIERLPKSFDELDVSRRSMAKALDDVTAEWDEAIAMRAEGTQHLDDTTAKNVRKLLAVARNRADDIVAAGPKPPKVAEEPEFRVGGVPFAMARKPTEKFAPSGQVVEDMRRTVGMMFEETESVRRAVQDELAKFRGVNDPNANHTRGLLMRTLEALDAEVGKAEHGTAGKWLSERNALLHEALRQKEYMAGRATGRVFRSDDIPVNTADIVPMIRGSTRIAGATDMENVFDYIAAESRVAAWAEKNLTRLTAEERAGLREIQESGKKLAGTVEKRARDQAYIDYIKRLQTRDGNASPSTTMFSSPGTTMLMLGGYALGGPLGALVGGALSTLVRPHALMRKAAIVLSRAKRGSDAFDRSTSSVASAIKSGTKMTVKSVARVVPPAIFAFSGDRRKRAVDRARHVAGAMVDPVRLTETIQSRIANIQDDLPHAADAITATSLRAYTFLRDKAPPAYQPMTAKEPMYDPIDLAKYERYLDGVEYPTWVFANMLTGVVTSEHVEAVRAVYPLRYELAKDRILAAVEDAMDEGRELGLQEATMLSMFFDVPLDPTLPMAQTLRAAMTSGEPMPESGGQLEQPVAPRPGIARRVQVERSIRETPGQRLGRGVGDT